MKIFGIGLSRTGTRSLTKALNILGFRVIHYPTDRITWNELMAGKCDYSLLKKYDGITDITVARYYPQLDHVFPNSKYILTVREKDSWLYSVKRVWEMRPAFDDRPEKEVAVNIRRFLRASVYGCYEFNNELMSYAYDMHYKNVREYFFGRPEAMLEINIIDGDGWEKLCPFLGKSPLDCPFPNIP